MSAELISEEPRPIAVVSRAHPATKSIHPKTLSRWAIRGVRGSKLESVRVGGRLMTTTAALDRFLAALNEKPVPSSPAVRSPAERRRASEAAAKELQAAGA